MLVHLKLRDRKEHPPTFLELLREIRTEEEYEAARVKLNSSVNKIHARTDQDSQQHDVQALKN